MAVIKSALELAMERAKNFTVDESAQKAAETKLEGRKAASRWLEAPESFDLETLIEKIDATQRLIFLKAAYEVFVAQIQLPTNSHIDAEKLEAAKKGIEILCMYSPRFKSEREARLARQQAQALMGQITQFLRQYNEEMKRVEQAIRNQWAPKLREKERLMAAQLGQAVRIDPMSDPEFVEFYRKNVEEMRKNYSGALEGAKHQLADICGFGED
ncbi:MAG: hypothetical protein N3A02_06830 [Rectinema sp.]|nr:hypothetical protein [Rectinema sp.]